MAHRIRLILSEVEGRTMTAPRSLLFYRKLLVSHRSSEMCACPSAKAGAQGHPARRLRWVPAFAGTAEIKFPPEPMAL